MKCNAKKQFGGAVIILSVLYNFVLDNAFLLWIKKNNTLSCKIYNVNMKIANLY